MSRIRTTKRCRQHRKGITREKKQTSPCRSMAFIAVFCSFCTAGLRQLQPQCELLAIPHLCLGIEQQERDCELDSRTGGAAGYRSGHVAERFAEGRGVAKP